MEVNGIMRITSLARYDFCKASTMTAQTPLVLFVVVLLVS